MLADHQRGILERLREEVALAEHQLQRSQSMRTRLEGRQWAQKEEEEPTTAAEPMVSSTAGRAASPEPTKPSLSSPALYSAVTPTTAPPLRSSREITVDPVHDTQKEGVLLLLVRARGPFGSDYFTPRYFVVDEVGGIMWYESEARYRASPHRPLAVIPFWRETVNSRGSRFKKAAVCWPLVLPEDCPATAADSSKTYFAIDYVNESGASDKIVLAANSPRERDSWVRFLTKYIDLYLAPRAESEELHSLPRGAAIPMHRSSVLDGEAPGGTYHT